jgi:hypothetical protein
MVNMLMEAFKGTGYDGIAQALAPEGWFYSCRFNQYQKTKGRVVVYVAPMMWGYTKAQLYLRGPCPGICDMEARHATDRTYIFSLGETWLRTYAHGDMEQINQDPYAIQNPEGVWNKDTHLERWWIGGK